MAKVYTLKIYPEGMGRKAYRVIQIGGQKSLDDLCDTILEAFEFDHDHLYEFCIGDKKYGGDDMERDEGFNFLLDMLKNLQNPGNDHLKPRKKTNAKNTVMTIDKLNLAEKQKFLLHYDFGDDWMFVITVQKVTEANSALQTSKIIKAKGHVEQYPDWDDEYDEEY